MTWRTLLGSVMPVQTGTCRLVGRDAGAIRMTPIGGVRRHLNVERRVVEDPDTSVAELGHAAESSADPEGSDDGVCRPDRSEVTSADSEHLAPLHRPGDAPRRPAGGAKILGRDVVHGGMVVGARRERSPHG